MSPEKQLARDIKQANASYSEVIREEIKAGVFDPDAQYICPKCRNKGVLYYADNGEMRVRICDCTSYRKTLKYIEESGLSSEIEEKSFDNFIAKTAIQKDCANKAQKYIRSVKDGDRKWFFVCGQQGSGKSHICTAIAGELLNSQIPVRYMLWRNDGTKLKANVNNSEVYDPLFNSLANAEVLYIDDYLKSTWDDGGKKARRPSDGDLNLAFTLINTRTLLNKTTIISCEYSFDQLYDWDRGTTGRIYKKAKDFNIFIPYDTANDYRMM